MLNLWQNQSMKQSVGNIKYDFFKAKFKHFECHSLEIFNSLTFKQLKRIYRIKALFLVTRFEGNRSRHPKTLFQKPCRYKMIKNKVKVISLNVPTTFLIMSPKACVCAGGGGGGSWKYQGMKKRTEGWKVLGQVSF